MLKEKAGVLDMTDAEVLSHYRVMDVPPDGFDAKTASDAALHKYGLRRPDAVKEPQLRAIWDDAVARGTKLVKSPLEVDRVISSRPHPLLESLHGSNDFAPKNWGGIVCSGASEGIKAPASIRTVSGTFVIPKITPVKGDPSSPLTVGFWVGIDGVGGTPGGSQLLQAGVAGVIAGSSVSYYFWTEWWPLVAVKPPGIALPTPVAGDTVSVVVCATDPTHGFAFFTVTPVNGTPVGQLIAITPPANLSLVGATAEWVAEGISADLPDFAPLTFTNISAGTGNGPTFNLSNMGDDLIFNITSSTSGNALTKAKVLSATSCQVTWLGSA